MCARTIRWAALALALAAGLASPLPARAQDSADARYEKAAALVQEKKFADAKKELEAAIKLDPAHVPSRRVLAALLRSEGKHEAAAKHLEAALAASPDDPKIMVELGNAWKDAAQRAAQESVTSTKKRDELAQKAIDAYRRCLEKDAAGYEGVTATIGGLECLMGKWAEAAATLGRYLEAHPDDRPALWNRAQAVDHTGPPEKSVEAWEAYIANAKGDPQAKKDVAFAEGRVKAIKKDAAKKDPKKKG
jgi:tetratricopeptide (TPR) repeat protein